MTALILAIAPAFAAPQVEIKARTQLSLTKVRLRDTGIIEVSGQLADKLTGDGLAHQLVIVAIGSQTESTLTESDGTFRATLAGEPGPQKVTLTYPGGGALERAAPLEVTTDPSKQQIELSIGKIADDPTGVKLRVTAVGDDGPVSIPIAVAIAPAGSETFRTLAGSMPMSNQTFVLARHDAGGPGMYRLRATFAGDDTHQAAMREGLVELTSSTITTMKLSATKLAYEDSLAVTGKVTDDDGKAVPNAVVALASGDRRLAQGTTAEDGSYKFSIEGDVLGNGEFGLQVQSDTGPFVKPSRSDPQIVKVAAPQPVPVSYTIAAFVATLLAAGAFFVARTKPWRRLRRATPPAEVPNHESETESVQGGLVVAKPGIVSTLRRAADDGFSGVVRDTVRGRPIAEAIVRVLFGEVEREVRTAADGSFSIEKLGVGEWRAEVAALGHVTETFAVTIPHRGELRGVRVDLVPVRERVFQLYRRAAEPILPEARLWGIWSPRQIVDHVRVKRPTPALVELTDFVEEIYFSPRLAAETVLPQTSERVDRAIHERSTSAR